MNRIPPTSTAVFFAFFLASCLASYCALPVKIGLIVLLLLCVLVLSILRRRIAASDFVALSRPLSGACLAGAIACMISLGVVDLYAEHVDSFAGETDTVTVQILETDYSLSYTTRYRAVIRESEHLPRGVKFFLNTSRSSLENGTILTGDVTYTSLDESGDSSFDARTYYLPKGILIAAEDESLRISGHQSVFSFSGFFTEANEWLTARITAHLDYEAGGLASAVLLGNKDSLSDMVARDFRRIGISHLLVISGTHFSVMVSYAERAMRRLHVNRRLRAVCNMGTVLLLMCLTGLTPSVLRAGIMHLLAQFSILVSKKPNVLHSFALSGAMIVLCNPYLAMDCGLQLSFIATYCCILFQGIRFQLLRPLRRRLGRKLWRGRLVRVLVGALESIGITTFVTLGTLPLIWLYFGEVSLISIPANLLAIPLVTVLMMLTLCYLLLYPLRLFILPMAALINGFCWLFRVLVGFFARFDWVMIALNYGFTPLFLFPLTVVLLLLPILDKKKRLHAAGAVVVLCVVFLSAIGIVRFTERDLVQISYVNVKKNDGIVLKSDNKCLLVDQSDGSFGFSYRLTDEMSELHCCEIEALLLTHYHNKHIQLFNRLAEREILRGLILPEPQTDTEASLHRALLETAEAHSVSVITIPAGETFRFGDVEIRMYERTYLSRSTHPIAALRVEAFGQSAVLASSSFNQGDPAIYKDLSSADYVILGAHSPVYKKTFDLVLDQPNAVWMCEDAESYMGDTTRASLPDGILKTPEEINRITIRPDGEKSSKSPQSGTGE